MDKKYEKFLKWNYVKRHGKSQYFRIEEFLNKKGEIVKDGKIVEIKEINISNGGKVEKVELSEMYGILLDPNLMIELGFSTSENLPHLKYNNDSRYGYRLYVYEKKRLQWIYLPNIKMLEASMPFANKGFLIKENALLDSGIDWHSIDTYLKKGILIPMDYFHQLQNYISANPDFASIDFASFIKDI